MKITLTIIVTILFLVFSGSTILAQKTGYCKTLSLESADHAEPNNLMFFSVPSNTKFVLERLYVSGQGAPRWSLTANSSFSISGKFFTNTYVPYQFNAYEFPNETAVFNTGDEFVLSYPYRCAGVFVTIIGYFEDTVAAMSADINGDGKVNMLDFAELSKQWLGSND